MVFVLMRSVFTKVSRAFHKALGQNVDLDSPRPPNASDSSETPRDVYLDACRRIAQAFTQDGFRYFKSGPHFTKNDGQFSFRVSFQSSHLNAPGRHVRLWLHANVRSARLKTWRLQQDRPCRTDDSVAGGMVHRLYGKQTMIQWDLANPNDREAVISDVIAFVRKEVFKYFQRFTDPGEVITALSTQEIGAFALSSSVEFALCFGNHEQAQRVLDRFLRQREDLRDEIQSVTERFRNEGFPDHMPSSFAEQVAWVRSSYNLA